MRLKRRGVITTTSSTNLNLYGALPILKVMGLVRTLGLWVFGDLRVVLQLADECFCNPEASENLSWLFVKSGRLAYHCPGGTFCWVVSLPSKEDRNFLVASGVHNDYSPVMVRTLSYIPSMCLLGLHGH